MIFGWLGEGLSNINFFFKEHSDDFIGIVILCDQVPACLDDPILL